MIESRAFTLPHGITLHARVTGEANRPVLLFLHGFPESAFVWDPLLEYFARPEQGGYRCVAPCMRGYPPSSVPIELSAYHAKHLVEDVTALVDQITRSCPTPGRVAALIAHDWGGAIAWNVAALHPDKLAQLVILNAPHAGTFLRDLQHSPAQQAASAYMRFLTRTDAGPLLAEDDYRRLWGFFETATGSAPWLTDAVRAQYRAVWQMGLEGPLNYYRASPLRPPSPEETTPRTLTLPGELLQVSRPTLVIWGMKDHALLPGLLDGLDAYVQPLQVEHLDDASHWLVHERPLEIARRIAGFLNTPNKA